MKTIFFLQVLVLLSLSAQSQSYFKNNKGLWGLKDKTGKMVVEPKFYNKPAAFAEGRSVFAKLNLKGVLDETGKEIVAPVYSSISDFKYGFAVAGKEVTDTSKKIGGKPLKYFIKGIIDLSGKEIVPVMYKELQGDFSNGWFVKAGNDPKQKMFINTSGQTFTVPADLLLMDERVDGKRFIAMKNGKFGLIDQQFKELLPFAYSRITPAGNGMLIVGENNLFGLMDSKLKWVVKPRFANIHKFQNGYAVISNEEKLHGAINAKGVITTTPQFEMISRIDKTSSAIALFRNRSDKSGLVDLATGKIIAPDNYNMFSSDYDYGLVTFRRENKKGIMDSTGKELFYAAYDDFSPGFLDNRAWVMKDKKYGFIDKTGAVVIPMQYEMVGGFVEGLAKIKVNGKYGYINPKGDIVIPVTYLDAQNFEAGMAWVKDETNRSFYIDKMGKELK